MEADWECENSGHDIVWSGLHLTGTDKKDAQCLQFTRKMFSDRLGSFQGSATQAKSQYIRSPGISKKPMPA
jgi:hypothetical protein